MAIDWTKLAEANAEISDALKVNQEINDVSPVGTIFYVNGRVGDPDFGFPSTQALINALVAKRQGHIEAAKTILNA